MSCTKHLIISVAAVAALATHSSALAQSAADERNLSYVGRGGRSVVMVADVPAAPARGQTRVWVWYLFGPGDERSTATGSFGRAMDMTVDCATRRTFNNASEQYLGSTHSNRSELSGVSSWVTPDPDSLGILPVRAVCDAAPATPHPVHTDLASARAFADLQLKPAPQ